MRVVFLGSPDFAVHSLEALLASKHEIIGLITQPDRPAGRGMKLKAPAVKIVAEKAGCEIFQPEKLNTALVYEWLEAKKPELLVVVAYGEFLGKRILEFCGRPPINVHPSLLPKFRGAAPIQWSLIKGETVSGVTVQNMVKKMDAGDILKQVKEPVAIDINAAQLHDHYAKVGAKILVETVDEIASGKEAPSPQDEAQVSFAPLLKKEDGKIDWKHSALSIHNQIRGLFPWPGAFTSVGGLVVKVRKSCLVPNNDSPPQKLSAGEFLRHRDSILVATGDGWLEILEVQPSGRRPQLPAEFSNGIKGQAEKGLSLKFE